MKPSTCLRLALILCVALCAVAACQRVSGPVNVTPPITPTLPATQPSRPTLAPSVTALSQPTATARVVPTLAPTQSPSPTLTATASAVPTAVPRAPFIVPTGGWLTYSNTLYGFSLRYPADWALVDDFAPPNTMRGHLVQLNPRTGPRVRLSIAFKRTNEDQRITPTGVGSGELVEKGSVTFLGEDLKRVALVAVGKDMMIYYGGTGGVRRGDLAFWMALDYLGNALDVTALTPETQALADTMVASIARVR